MKCTPILGGFACGRRQPTKRCQVCGRDSTRECDYPLRGRKSGKTCSAPICDVHAHQHGTHASGPYKGDRIDYCPAHHEQAAKEPTLPGVT